MNEQEFLNENTYRKNKHTLTIVASLILGFSLIVGAALIIIGLTSKTSSPASLQIPTLNESESPLEMFNSAAGTIHSSFNSATSAMQNNFKSNMFIMIGIALLFFGLITSAPIFIFAHHREIFAFQAQQIIPIAKEATEKVTPTAAKAAGTVAESVAEGITRGVKKAKSDSEK